MAENTINWGKIYDSSWFGDGVTANSIDWGSIYRDIAGFPVFVELYDSRVTTDGGVVESLRCISDNLQVISRPVITLLGNNPDYVDIDNTYSDSGATAFDEFLYGDITSSITSVSTVDTREAGIYAVDYEVVDQSENTDIDNRVVYVLSELAIDYRDRIALDGGSVENLQCVDFDYDVNWGYYLNLQSGVDRFISDYETRVSTDLGTMESINCIRFSDLTEFDWTYNYRVLDDSGVVESLGCININELINK